jgi:hypothetical protein
LFRSTVILRRPQWRRYRCLGSPSSDAIGVISLIVRASDHDEARNHRHSTHLVSFPRPGTVEYSPHHQKIRLYGFGGTTKERISNLTIYF